MNRLNQQVWTPRAWVGGQWQADVLLEIDAKGLWHHITPNTPAPELARKLDGALLPGLVNAHSHAFQRAFVGLSEVRQSESDDFWSWRQQMYGVALKVTPDSLHRIAKQLYTELLQGGYSHVCEFHYLHHQIDGTPYPAFAQMSLALVQAAHDVGMGMTLLPVLYERAGFEQPQLRAEQRRFKTDVDAVLTLRQQVQNYVSQFELKNITVGVAVHSLRAAKAESIAELWEGVKDDSTPIHIHIAEQTGEVDDCLKTTGQRPIEWLCNGLGQGVQIDEKWHLVHATHALPSEIDAVAKTGAGMVLCPSTEANLGDGLTDLPHWFKSGVPISIGSDSHVTRDWREELRLAEYGQRLIHRKRNVLAETKQYGGSTAARLFERAVQAGGVAAGHAQWGLEVGARAVGMVCQLDAPFEGIDTLEQENALLDRLVFSSPSPMFKTLSSLI